MQKHIELVYLPVWPGLAKFLSFKQLYLVFGKLLNLLDKSFMLLGK